MENQPSLLELRGHFFSPELKKWWDILPPLLNHLEDGYLVTDEHAILISGEKAILVNIQSQETLWAITSTGTTASALNLPQQLLALATFSDLIFLWDLRSGELVQTLDTDSSGGLSSILLNADASLLVVGQNTGVQIWRVADGTLLHILWGGDGDCEGSSRSIAFSPDGQLVASGHFDSEEVWVWRAADGQQIYDLQDPGGRVAGLAFSPDGNMLVCGDGERGKKSIRTWDMRTGRAISPVPWHGLDPIFSPDGRFLASTDRARQSRFEVFPIFLWDVERRCEVRQLISHTGHERLLAFSPSGRTLLSFGADRIMRCWDVQSGQEICQLRFPFKPILPPNR